MSTDCKAPTSSENHEKLLIVNRLTRRSSGCGPDAVVMMVVSVIAYLTWSTTYRRTHNSRQQTLQAPSWVEENADAAESIVLDMLQKIYGH